MWHLQFLCLGVICGNLFADLESFIQCIVGIKSSNLIRSHPCAFVLQASCLIEITFSAVMPRSEIHYEILLPLFVVLEKLRAPPWTHTGIELGATFVCLKEGSLFLHLTERSILSAFCYCWRRQGGMGAGGRALLYSPTLLQLGDFWSLTVWQKVVIATQVVLSMLNSSDTAQKQQWTHLVHPCPLPSVHSYPCIPTRAWLLLGGQSFRCLSPGISAREAAG